VRKIGIGVVGCGVVCTRDLLPNLVLPEVQERLDLVAVCDVVESRARDTAEQFGARAYTDVEEMVRHPDIEIVGITTPVRHHLPVALAAIAAGKHIYVQKTMTETVAEADQMIAAAREKGVKILAAPGNHIRSKPLAEIREHIRAGRLGKVCWGRSALGTRHEDDARRLDDPARNVDPSWYYKPGGGPLRDAAVYDLHALTWMLGG
jgi:predicted dehydrogenase